MLLSESYEFHWMFDSYIVLNVNKKKILNVIELLICTPLLAVWICKFPPIATSSIPFRTASLFALYIYVYKQRLGKDSSLVLIIKWADLLVCFSGPVRNSNLNQREVGTLKLRHPGVNLASTIQIEVAFPVLFNGLS